MPAAGGKRPLWTVLVIALLADLLVLDRDYLTIPSEEIENLRVLMTVVGGKIEHLVPPLSAELGLAPQGAQYETGFWQERFGSN